MDNLPEVPPEKFAKLSSVVHKIFSKAGNIRPGTGGYLLSCSSVVCVRSMVQARTCAALLQNLDVAAGIYGLIALCQAAEGLLMPLDETTKVSKGFAFIEFSAPQVGVAAAPHLLL